MSKRKFRVGVEVRIKNVKAVGGEEFETVGVITAEDVEDDRVIGYTVKTEAHGFIFAGTSYLELLPMNERPSYLRGVALANERRKAKEERLKATVDAFSDWGASALAESLTAAKAHRDAQRAKYATQAKTSVKFTPVAKGSVPIVLNPLPPNTRILGRAFYRRVLHSVRRDGFETIEAWNAHMGEKAMEATKR